eukprot:TRINITY_DN684_c0_g1_i2.p1 TRINITY_DN684_c0_g1~~TRINITY_DN684_c0_g1_i2.p1  ORF type:complete len:232 (-),score=83.87 TRINITY_DN684_c0_g1_i2:92-697(-)
MDSPKTLFPSTPEKNQERQEKAASTRKNLWEAKVSKAQAELQRANELAAQKKESEVIEVPVFNTSNKIARLPSVHQRLVNSPKTIYPGSPAKSQARQEKAAAIRKELWEERASKSKAEVAKGKKMAADKKGSGVIEVTISTPSKPGRLPSFHQRLVASPKTLFPSTPEKNQERQEKAAALRKNIWNEKIEKAQELASHSSK